MKGLIVIALLLGGCASPSCQAVQALRTSWGVISKEYMQYVEADPVLDNDQRARRKLHVEKHAELLAELGRPCDED